MLRWRARPRHPPLSPPLPPSPRRPRRRRRPPRRRRPRRRRPPRRPRLSAPTRLRLASLWSPSQTWVWEGAYLLSRSACLSAPSAHHLHVYSAEGAAGQEALTTCPPAFCLPLRALHQPPAACTAPYRRRTTASLQRSCWSATPRSPTPTPFSWVGLLRQPGAPSSAARIASAAWLRLLQGITRPHRPLCPPKRAAGAQLDVPCL